MDGLDLYDWRKVFRREGLTASVRLALLEALSPRVALREPFHLPEEVDEGRGAERIKDIVDWEIVLNADHVHTSLRDMPKDDRWTAALPELLADFTSLLRDALDLMRELGGADNKSDLSYVQQPSISEHPQNRGFRDWTALIDLTRDAWLATVALSPERACSAAEGWSRVPYPLFRRLAFFAAAQDAVIPAGQALDWLLADERWWLWSVETEREGIRLLAWLARRLGDQDLQRLEEAILAGPPREMFKDDIEPERWTGIEKREIWLRLAKLAHSGAALGQSAKGRLEQIGTEHPRWQIAPDERDEFPYWMSDGDEWRKFVSSPRSRRELTTWLRQYRKSDHWEEDDWRQRCRDNFATTTCALCALAKDGFWPVDRWREALQAWSEEKLHRRSWRYMAPVIAAAPSDVLGDLASSISFWLRSIAKTFGHHEALFVELANRMLSVEYEDEPETDDPVGRAINRPVGYVTEALLHWWYRTSLEDGQGLPTALRTMFSELCDTRISKFRHGRVLLAAHAIALFRVDGEWARVFLLPLFDWRASELEARCAWEGFLWSPRLYRPFIEAIKRSFLATARHYAHLGDHDSQYAAILTFAALDPGDTFTVSELAGAFRELPPTGLQESAQALVRALDGAGEQRVEFWSNRVVPFVRGIWPNARSAASPSIADSFGRLCVATGDAFPDALSELRAWLQPVKHPHNVVHRLHLAGICKRFPEPALEFLDLLIGDEAQWPPGDLDSCLKDLRSSAARLEADQRYQRLRNYLRAHNKGAD
jgi:hypothetical protein